MTTDADVNIDKLLDEVVDAIVDCDSDQTVARVQLVLAAGVDPVFAVKNILSRAADIVGKKFDEGEYYLPHLVMAGDAMTAITDALEPAMPKGASLAKKVVVLATVEADLHSVGKNIVGMMLKASGFEVHDLGVDVRSTTIIAKVKEVNAAIIALSSLLTTTMPYQREVIEDLKAARIRERFNVIVGGGAVTKDWADQIGADGYGRDAVEAVTVKVARELVGTATGSRGAEK